MAGNLNLTGRVLGHSLYAYQWAQELEKSLEGNPEAGTVAKAIVDAEMLFGMTESLSRLIDRVDHTSRNLLIRDIELIQVKLEDIRLTMSQKTIILIPPKVDIEISNQTDPLIGLDKPTFFFANHNQYSKEFEKYYQGQSYQRSACTAIAGQFVLITLKGTGSNALNEILHEGQKIYARVMQERPPRQGEHCEFRDIIREKEFCDLKEMDIPQDLAENPYILNVNLLNGKNAFGAMLGLLDELRRRSQLKEIGAVFSARGESLGIAIVPDDPDVEDSQLIVLFDSHGCKNLTKDPQNRAYAVAFTKIDDAAQFLADREPVIADFDHPHYNSGTITPLCLHTYKTDHDEIRTPQLAYSLNDVVQALEKKDEEGFFKASSLIAELSDQKCHFEMTEREPKSVGDRIFFHLFYLHKKEAPEKLNQDPNHGSTAFQAEAAATPDERLRSAQRAMIEVAFAGIEETILYDDTTGLQHYLNLLEGLNLHRRDLPENKKNIAHYLFERLYFHYKDAAESDKSLIHPHDGAFRGDFGRTAFRNEAAIAIDPTYKLNVIKQVRDQLKQIWSI
jgi:hypothetical protein